MAGFLDHLDTGLAEIDRKAFEHSGMPQAEYNEYLISREQIHNGGLKLPADATHEEKLGFKKGTPPETVAHVEGVRKAARDAKKNFHAALDSHFEPGKFGSEPPPHLSDGSVRAAAGKHFDLVRAVGKDVHTPEHRHKLWADLHENPYGSHPVNVVEREGLLEKVATDAHGNFDQGKYNELLHHDAKAAATIADHGQLKALHEIEAKPSHFMDLPADKRAAHIDYLQSEHAHPDMKTHVRSAAPTTALKKAETFMHDGAQIHAFPDGTVAHVKNGSLLKLQEGAKSAEHFASIEKTLAPGYKSWQQRITSASHGITDAAESVNKAGMGFAKVAGTGAGALLSLHALSSMAREQKNGNSPSTTDYAELIAGVGLAAGSLLLHRGR